MRLSSRDVYNLAHSDQAASCRRLSSAISRRSAQACSSGAPSGRFHDTATGRRHLRAIFLAIPSASASPGPCTPASPFSCSAGPSLSNPQINNHNHIQQIIRLTGNTAGILGSLQQAVKCSQPARKEQHIRKSLCIPVSLKIPRGQPHSPRHAQPRRASRRCASLEEAGKEEGKGLLDGDCRRYCGGLGHRQ